MFISIKVIFGCLAFVTLLISSDNFNLLSNLSELARDALFAYFSILVWYDNLENLPIKTKDSFYIHLLKLIIIILLGIIWYDFQFTYTYTIKE